MIDLDYQLPFEEQLTSILGGALSGKAATFIEAGQKYGVDPAMLAAISMHETANGTSNILKTKNNAAGIFDSKANTYREFTSIDDSIDFAARNLSKNYLSQGLTDLASIGNKYAPPGAGNDVGGMNKDWPSGVASYMSKITGSVPAFDSNKAAFQPPITGQEMPVISIGNAIPEIDVPADYRSQGGMPNLLTSIGSDEPEITSPEYLGDYNAPQADQTEPEEDDTTDSAQLSTAKTLKVPPPSFKGHRPIKVNPDGTVLWSNNASIDPNTGHVTQSVSGATLAWTSKDSAAIDVTPKASKVYDKFTDKNGQRWERDDKNSPYKNVTPEGAAKVRTEMTPSEQLNLRKNEVKTYGDNQATIMMYGKGQMPGLYQIKSRLDSLYDSARGDYSKLKDSPQSQATFVYQFSKFNDPNSAVLLGEYNAAAERLGIADRFKLAIDRAKRGDVLSVTQMRDIQQTINTAYNKFKDDHFADLKQREPELEAMGLSLQKLGVPPGMQKEYEEWKKTAEPETQSTPATSTAVPGKVHVKNPEGQTGWIPAEQLEAAKAKGYEQIP